MSKYKQKHSHKWIEIFCNTVSGMILAVLCTQIGDWFDLWDITLEKNILLTAILTLLSVIRTFFWRIVFDHHNNKRLERKYD